ncbi:MAG: hypothetical protein WA988_01850 [Candidatus Nanopelagicales bacterium]|jgi:hypothetical protein
MGNSRHSNGIGNRRQKRTLALLGLATGLFLAAATIPSGSIAAAQQSSDAPATPSVKGCSISLKNDTNQTLRFERPSGFKATVVPSGSQSLCGNDDDSWHSKNYDVLVKITDQKSNEFNVVTHNPFGWSPPYVAVAPTADKWFEGTGIAEGGRATVSNGAVPYKVLAERHGDTDDFKHFTLRIVSR